MDIQEESKIKRIFIITTSIFLIILFLTYLLPGYDLLSILEGKIVSNRLIDLQLTLRNGNKVVFTNEAYLKLKDIYLKNQRTEFSSCLLGYKENNNYRVTDLYIPKTHQKTVFEVASELCNKDTIIALHSHPYKHCIFSSQDINYYNNFKEVNPEGMIGLICELNRFTFYPD